MHRALIILFFWCSILAANATSYVVNSAMGGASDSNDGLSNTSGHTWLTIGKAASTMVAGDTTTVYAGTYGGFTESTDGTSGNMITYVANGAVTINTIVTLSGDYIRFIGFTVDVNFSSANAIAIAGAVGVEVWNCTVKRSTNRHIAIDNSSSKTLIIGNFLQGTFGTAGSTGESKLLEIFGLDEFIAYNTMTNANEDWHILNGKRIRIIGENISSPNTASAAHVDVFQNATSIATEDILAEANFYVDSGATQSDHHWSNLQTDGLNYTNWLSRFNVSHMNGTGSEAFFEGWRNVYFFHNDYLETQMYSSQASVAEGLFTHSTVSNVRSYNNIFFETWGTSVSAPQVYEFDGSGVLADYDLAWDKQGGSPTWSAPFTSEAHRVTADPSFVDYANKNFRLGGGSGAIGVGGPVTTVTSGSSTGTSFDVGDAGFFRGDNTTIDQYSGNLIVGDKITVGTDQRTITTISGNTITVDSSFTWANGDSVWLGWDTTPDIGAYPFSSSALTAATYVLAGTTYTVTPNGDCRFVVFYQDGIPVAVDNSSPYSASISSGTVTIRAYPLYASQTTSVLATDAGGGGDGSLIFYASATGSMSNDGLTPSTPWTLAGAITNSVQVTNGVKIRIIGTNTGPYVLDQRMRGTEAGGYITFESYPSKWSAVINGSATHGFIGSSSGGSEAQYIKVDGLHIHGNAQDGTGGNNHWIVTNCWIEGNGLQGVDFSSPTAGTNQVWNSLIENNGTNTGSPGHYHGVYFAGQGNVAAANLIRRNGSGAGIQLYTEDVSVKNWDNQFYENTIYGHTNLYGLVCWNGNEDSGSSHLLGTNKVFGNTLVDGLGTAYGTIYVSNNIIFPNPIAPSDPINASGSPRAPTVVANYNVSSVTITPTGANDVTSTMAAEFVSTNTGLFWLKSGALARNAAKTTVAAPVDWFGNAQSSVTDIGSVQYSAALAADTRTLDPSGTTPDYWLNLSLTTGSRPPVSLHVRRR